MNNTINPKKLWEIKMMSIQYLFVENKIKTNKFNFDFAYIRCRGNQRRKLNQIQIAFLEF